ncbi:Oxysterol-binding protein 4 [Neophaeococcomyces mojaviensis]|uniref:Oxysterol-binding protein 4 n=1 Tax=Neophaeococcomyces mojaviensis TaxID=3383035 RepID=A0ACC3A540_9EURO|nr:Oxysterol-binding protein 4 [Knufia sp. JES_112]
MPAEVEGGAVPASSRGSWTTFLKSIASFNGDLASLTAPAFILSSQSLVEFSAYWTENQELWIAPTKEPDPAKRALLVVRWLINTLHQQYCSRSEKFGNEKKPLNPFLGELFLGYWEEGNLGRTELVSEQVSHHPPVTAYCITNEKNRIQLQGYNGQKASFSRTIHIKQIGHSLLTLYPPGSNEPESYLITLPALHIENLIYGAPFVECGKYTHVVSSSGYTAKIDYSGKGWLSGKKNSFTAALWKEGEGSEKKPLYSLDGQWSDMFTIKEGDGGKRSKDVETVKTSAVRLSKLNVPPIEEQDVMESRKAWGHVARSIEKGDMDATSAFKSRIENAQRALRKREQDENRTWKRVFFSQPDDEAGSVKSGDPLERRFNHLAKVATAGQPITSAWEGVAPEKTNGIWRYDEEKGKKAQRPFHSDGLEALGETEGNGSAAVSRTTTTQSQGQQPIVSGQ